MPAEAPTKHNETRRRRLPKDRDAKAFDFNIAGHCGEFTVGHYADGTPGEIFIRMSKQGSTISGLLDSFATAVSIAWQYGVPLEVYADKFIGKKFEPRGCSTNKEIGVADSIVDYIFRVLMSRYGGTK